VLISLSITPGAIRSIAEIALFDQTIDAYQRAATLDAEPYDAGIVSRADVEQANTQLASAQAQLIRRASAACPARARHCGAAWRAAGDVLTRPTPLTGDPPLVPKSAIAHSRKAARYRISGAGVSRRANAQIGVASAAFFPAVTPWRQYWTSSDAFGRLVVVVGARLVSGAGAGVDAVRRRGSASGKGASRGEL
jgi:outer membrane protein TolC